MTFSRPAKVKYELYCPVATNSNIIQIKNIGMSKLCNANIIQLVNKFVIIVEYR